MFSIDGSPTTPEPGDDVMFCLDDEGTIISFDRSGRKIRLNGKLDLVLEERLSAGSRRAFAQAVAAAAGRRLNPREYHNQGGTFFWHKIE